MKTPGPELTQAWPRPAHPQPIVIIGAGAIVRTAHLPVYRRLGYPVAGIFDIDPAQRARHRARVRDRHDLRRRSAEAAARRRRVFDVAVPGDQIVGILEQLPRGAAC